MQVVESLTNLSKAPTYYMIKEMLLAFYGRMDPSVKSPEGVVHVWQRYSPMKSPLCRSTLPQTEKASRPELALTVA